MDIEQEFVITDMAQDSLTLSLKAYGPMQQMFSELWYQHLSLTYKQQNEEISIPYQFDGVSLSFALPANSCTLKVAYQFWSDYFTHSVQGYFCPFKYSWHSWYFNAPDMKISHVEIEDVDAYYMLVNLPSIKTEHSTILEASSINDDEGVSFYLFKKEYYEKKTFLHGSNTINLYLTKGQGIVPKTNGEYGGIGYPEYRLTDQKINDYIQKVQNAFNKLDSIIFPKENAEFTIFEADLTMIYGEATFMWSAAIPIWKENKFALLLDTTCITENNTLLHELIHTYYNNLLPPEEDSTHLLFGEAMTEYLSKCLYYDNMRQRDSSFNRDMIDFAGMDNKVYSVYSNDSGTEGERVRYLRAPFVIHEFAQILGEDKFIHILSQFFKEAKIKKQMRLSDLESLLKANGISDKQWKWLIKNL
jgi:hypothetical protein